MTIKVLDALNAIKETGNINGILTWNPLNLRLDKHDSSAIEIIELIQDNTFGDAIEILQDAIFWLMFINSVGVADKELDKGKKRTVVLTRNK